jgi:Family of unknown function (DUF5687)
MILGAVSYASLFLLLGISVFYILNEKLNVDPLMVVNKYLIYYFIFDLVLRQVFQKIPMVNIRPLLILPIKRKIVVNFSIGKTTLSFFNLVHFFFFIPFTAVLLYEGYSVFAVLIWFLGIVSLILINNFLNIILNNKDNLFLLFFGVLTAFAFSQYYNYFDVTIYTSIFYQGLFNTKWLFIIPILVLIALYYFTFQYFKNNLYLDAGLSKINNVAKTENLTWLNQYGTLGTFLKNDIKLIKRNKRSRTTALLSLMFLFYGLLFFSSGIKSYDNSLMHLFAGIFVSGGFLITFGQFVPSWDSAFYPLMMTQNIPYKGYLSSKWWLMVIATIITTIIASFYLYFGVKIYLMIVVGAIYNIGINSHLVLLGGAYTKTPIDLSSTKGAFGDKKAFNVKTILISIPQMGLPMLIFFLGSMAFNENIGLLLVASFGLLGFAFKEKAFLLIEKVYKTEKYKTLLAYKQVS